MVCKENKNKHRSPSSSAGAFEGIFAFPLPGRMTNYVCGDVKGGWMVVAVMVDSIG